MTLSRRSLLVGGLFPFWPFSRRTLDLAGIRLKVVRNGSLAVRYLWIHGSEKTAGAVLTEHIKHHKGVAFLIQNDVRYITRNGVRYDPNRIWSKVGADRNLAKLNPGLDWSGVGRELDEHRGKIIDKLLPPAGGLMIAVHNNSEGYSVDDEIPISDRVSIASPTRRHNFMLCTDPGDFDRLSNSKHNVVLQQKAPPEDDGSFSRLAASRGVRYVNLEVEMGHADEQRELLAWIVDRLK